MSSEALPGVLRVIATPIGNLEDITLRALRVLQEADIIAAEDTRRTLKLLNHFKISKPLFSYYKEVEQAKARELLERLQAGKSIALVTDAGTPGVSDPGMYLIGEAIRLGMRVEVIPGASALLVALLGSGLPMEDFTFRGFLDTRSGVRRKRLESWKTRPETQIFFIAPHQVRAVLKDCLEAWGDRPAALGRELTKIHEEYLRGTLLELTLRAGADEPRGEYTLVVGGSTEPEPAGVPTETLAEQLDRLQAQGLSLNQAVAQAARERKMPRAEVYALAHARTKEK